MRLNGAHKKIFHTVKNHLHTIRNFKNKVFYVLTSSTAMDFDCKMMAKIYWPKFSISIFTNATAPWAVIAKIQKNLIYFFKIFRFKHLHIQNRWTSIITMENHRILFKTIYLHCIPGQWMEIFCKSIFNWEGIMWKPEMTWFSWANQLTLDHFIKSRVKMPIKFQLN
jgi:hypothetical protein